MAKIGIVLFILLGVATALTGNWVAAGGMLVFTVLEVTMLITTKSAS